MRICSTIKNKDRFPDKSTINFEDASVAGIYKAEDYGGCWVLVFNKDTKFHFCKDGYGNVTSICPCSNDGWIGKKVSFCGPVENVKIELDFGDEE